MKNESLLPYAIFHFSFVIFHLLTTFQVHQTSRLVKKPHIKIIKQTPPKVIGIR